MHCTVHFDEIVQVYDIGPRTTNKLMSNSEGFHFLEKHSIFFLEMSKIKKAVEKSELVLHLQKI